MIQVGVVNGDLNVNHVRASGAPPRQLPPPPVHFTGREAEAAAVRAELVNGSGRIGSGLVVVTGPGGVGKTALALHALHSTAHHFADGQLYVDLMAHRRRGPASPKELLGSVLFGLGVSAVELPPDLDRRAGLYRSMTAGGEIAILLDNAASAAQVRALLPASPRSAVVVTSRRRLSGLVASGARLVPLDTLPRDASVEMLRRAVGEHRVDDEPQSARDVAELCGGMPIAVHVVAARLVARPRWRLATIAAELTDERRRLRALEADDGELSVAATFDLSYRGLPADAARLYRLLGLHPGTDFDSATAAAALGEPDADVGDLLDVLLGANLLTEIAADRFRFHDLLRLHARRQAERFDSDEVRRAAVRATVLSYLDRLVAADRVVTPLRPHLGERYRAPAAAAFGTPADALDWMERVLPNLLACMRTAFGKGWYDLVWQFYEGLWGLFLYRGHPDEWQAAGGEAVEAAVRCGDAVAEVRMLLQSAAVHTRLRCPEAAVPSYRGALLKAKDIGDWQGEATALEGLGAAAHALGRPREAVDHYRESLALNERHGQRRGVALLLCYLGHAEADLGNQEAASESFRSSAAVAEEIGDRHCRAQAVVGLASCLARSGALANAVAEVEGGLADLPAQDVPALRLPVLDELADLLERAGRKQEAIERRREALDLAAALGDPRAHGTGLGSGTGETGIPRKGSDNPRRP